MSDSYSKTRTQSKSADEHHKNTVARLQQIQAQFKDTPGTGKLKDKVCIITGVGSLKGIGYVSLAPAQSRDILIKHAHLLSGVLLRFSLLAKVRTISPLSLLRLSAHRFQVQSTCTSSITMEPTCLT
jgi:hypothetical protein